MHVTITSIASGSSGNALLLRYGSAAILLDCGLPQRTIEAELRRHGLEPRDLLAVVLTHEHTDHACSAGALARRHKLALLCNSPTREALGDALAGVAVELLETGAAGRVGPFELQSFAVAHDAAAPLGFRISCAGCQIALAIDLGSWDQHLVHELSQSDLLVIEANHDRERLLAAPYPWPTKQRIFGPLGHLDNLAAGELLAQIGADGRPRQVWLAHLSAESNSPALALRSVNAVLALKRIKNLQLAVAPRRAPISWSAEQRLRQSQLFDE